MKELKKAITLAKHGVDSAHVHTRHRGRHKDYLYDFGYGLPLVNALFLSDVMEALPNCEAYFSPGKLSAPIYFLSGKDDGILLPIKKETEYEPDPAAAVLAADPNDDTTLETVEFGTSCENDSSNLESEPITPMHSTSISAKTSVAKDEATGQEDGITTSTTTVIAVYVVPFTTALSAFMKTNRIVDGHDPLLNKSVPHGLMKCLRYSLIMTDRVPCNSVSSSCIAKKSDAFIKSFYRGYTYPDFLNTS